MSIGNLGIPEVVIILLILVLLFGGSRIPKVAAALGSTIRQFKKGLSESPESVDGRAK